MNAAGVVRMAAEVRPGHPARQKLGAPPPEVVRDGYISVLGFGSLLSERSCRYTAPNLRNFRLARVQGWRRVFAHCAPIFFERGIARLETREMASLSAEPSAQHSFLATLFDIPETEFAALEQREAEFELLPVLPSDLQGEPMEAASILCARSSDEEYRRRHCQVFAADCQLPSEKVPTSPACPCVACTLASYGVDRIWRREDDVLPCRTYLRHCVLAAQGLGDVVYNDFLDNTFLSDRKTTVRTHLARDPTIMEELPPEALKERYCG